MPKQLVWTYYYGACVRTVNGETVTNNNCSTAVSVVVSTVYNGNLILSTQAQIDAFAYTEVTGKLTIKSASTRSILNLNALSSLTTVGGNFLISFNSSLNSLNGVNNLNRVEGCLNILVNPNINTLNGLDGLTFVGGYLSIQSNGALRNLCAVRQLDNQRRNTKR